MSKCPALHKSKGSLAISQLQRLKTSSWILLQWYKCKVPFLNVWQPVCSRLSLNISAISLEMPAICSKVQRCAWQCPNQAFHASHLCGGLRHGVSCHLLLPSETAHLEHWRGQGGQRCSQAEESQEAEVLMGEGLEALGAHGRVRGVEPATAVAVICGVFPGRSSGT